MTTTGKTVISRIPSHWLVCDSGWAITGGMPLVQDAPGSAQAARLYRVAVHHVERSLRGAETPA